MGNTTVYLQGRVAHARMLYKQTVPKMVIPALFWNLIIFSVFLQGRILESASILACHLNNNRTHVSAILEENTVWEHSKSWKSINKVKPKLLKFHYLIKKKNQMNQTQQNNSYNFEHQALTISVGCQQLYMCKTHTFQGAGEAPGGQMPCTAYGGAFGLGIPWTHHT